MNAIIIAAGMGTRLRPLTLSTPKPLIKIFGKPMIERNIEFLLEKGLKEIIIVTGYLGEQFSYLEEKYPEVKLVHNDKFNEYNNIYSFYLIKDYLEDSYILDGDIYLNRNIFEKNLDKSMYFSKKLNYQNDEWQLILENEKIKEVQIGGKNNYIMSGISFWKKEESIKLKKFVEKYVLSEEKKKNYYWDYIVKENIEKFNVGIYPLKDSDIFEIDNLEELKEIDNSYSDEEVLLEFLKDVPVFKDKKIENINLIGGMTNKNYLITIDGKKYVLRNPGAGTKEMISRDSEAKNAQIISDLNLDAKLIYLNKETGIKISEYIENAETLVPETARNNFKQVAEILKKLHNSDIVFDNIFDSFNEMEKYEKLSIKENGKFYDGYKEIKEKVFKLREKLKNFNIELKACHNDTVPENFIKSENKIYLIDWEYSGMNDPMWDLAAHSLECNFSKDEEKEFLNFYFPEEVSKECILRIQIHKICQDFLWSIWTVLKEAKGVSFGDYGIMRFKRAVKLLGELKDYE